MCSAERYMERISTRVSGQRSTIRRVASTPSSSGMAISMMTMSGRSRSASLTASRPLPATATTCRSLPPSSRARSPSRTTAWSSASITDTGISSPDSSVVFHENLHAAVGARFQRELRADRLGSLAHDQQAPPGFRAGTFEALWIDVYSVVAHREYRAAVLAPDRDFHALGVGVLGDVVERFLRDAEHGEIDRLGEIRPPAFLFEGDVDPGPAGEAGRERAQRRRKPVVVERVRSELGHHVPHGIDRAFDERVAILQARGEVGLGPRGKAAGDDGKVDAERGEVLPHAVVQLHGKETALGLLHLDQPARRGL